jgi:hypothetical protein
MNWKRYGMLSIFIFVINVAYKLCEFTIALLFEVIITVLVTPIDMMIWDNAADTLSDGAKVHLYNKLYGKN